MKICIIGDTHFRYQLPYASAVEDGRKSEWEAVKAKMIETAETSDVVVLMGDIFNMKHNHSAVNAEVIEFLQAMGERHIYILAGNHDRAGNTTAIDYIAALKHPNWHVYTEPTLSRVQGIPVMFLPYMTPGTIGAANVSEAVGVTMGLLQPAKYLFHHHIVESTEWGAGDSSIVNEVVLPKQIEDNYELIFGGHIHQSSKVTDKVYVTGNIFTNEVGEHRKAIFTLDTDTNEVEQIILPCRGIYKVEISGKNHVIPETIPDHSIVKVIVMDRSLQGAGVEEIRKQCKRFDSYILIEQYSNKRTKIDLSEAGGLDFSIEALMKVYSETRKVPHGDLMAALALIED